MCMHTYIFIMCKSCGGTTEDGIGGIHAAMHTGQRDGIDHYETMHVRRNELDGSDDDRLTSAGLQPLQPRR